MTPGDSVSGILASVTTSSLLHFLGPIIPGFFAVDPLSLVVLVGLAALAVLLILCLPVIGSFLHHLVLLFFFFGSAFGLVTAQNAVVFYVTWEITTLFAWGIGQLAADAEPSEQGMIPFQAAGVLGSFAMLFGLTLLVLGRQTLSFTAVNPTGSTTAGASLIPLLFLLAIVLKTYGVLAAIWYLPPRRGLSLAGAVLAGAGVLAIGMYPFFRFFGLILGQTDGWREPTFWAASALAILAVLAALGEPDYRRALSYGALSQFGLLAAVFTLGTTAAVLGALVGAIANAFAFTGLFLCVSAAEEATAQVLLRKVGGLAQRLPVTAMLFVICSLSLVGLPPLGGYLANRLIGAAVETSRVLPFIWLFVVGLSLVYLVKLFAALFLGELRGPVRRERRWSSLIASGGIVGALTLLSTQAAGVLALLGPLARQLPG